jgi:hypothetical protein
MCDTSVIFKCKNKQSPIGRKFAQPGHPDYRVHKLRMQLTHVVIFLPGAELKVTSKTFGTPFRLESWSGVQIVPV